MHLSVHRGDVEHTTGVKYKNMGVLSGQEKSPVPRRGAWPGTSVSQIGDPFPILYHLSHAIPYTYHDISV